MRYLKWIVPLTLLYIALTTNAEPLNWLLGVLLASGIIVLLQPDPAPVQWRHLPQALWGALRFALTLLWDLLVSSLQVTRLVLQRDMPLRQGVFALPSESSLPLVTLLSAHAITLTPGELVIEIDDDGVLYTHSLDVMDAAAKGPAAQRRRVEQLEKVFK